MHCFFVSNLGFFLYRNLRGGVCGLKTVVFFVVFFFRYLRVNSWFVIVRTIKSSQNKKQLWLQHKGFWPLTQIAKLSSFPPMVFGGVLFTTLSTALSMIKIKFRHKMTLNCLKNCLSLIPVSRIFSHKMVSHLHFFFLWFSMHNFCPYIFWIPFPCLIMKSILQIQNSV